MLVHLIEKYHLRQGCPLDEAVRIALTKIKGSYAFCVISQLEGDRLVAARNGSPLVVGLGENQNFIASDATALLDHTQRVVFLEDYQMVVVSKDSVSITF